MQTLFPGILINRLKESTPHLTIHLKNSSLNLITLLFVNDFFCHIYFLWVVKFLTTKGTKNTKGFGG
jgi:hypothetical protein